MGYDRGRLKDPIEDPQRPAGDARRYNHAVRGRDPHVIEDRARRAADRFEDLHRCYRMARARIEQQLDVVRAGGSFDECVADEETAVTLQRERRSQNITAKSGGRSPQYRIATSRPRPSVITRR